MADSNPFFGATFAERKAAREKNQAEADVKQVEPSDDIAENKSVSSGESKGRRNARKKS